MEAGSIVEMALFDSAIIQDLLGRYQLRQAKLAHPYDISECLEGIRRELEERRPFFELQCCESIASLMIRIFRGEVLTEKTGAGEGSFKVLP